MSQPTNLSRRSFAGLSLAAVGAFALTACNSQAADSGSAGSSGADGAPKVRIGVVSENETHRLLAKLAKEGYEFLMIGHKGHPEVEGTMGQLLDGIYLVEDEADVHTVQPRQSEKLAVVTQTTLSVDDAASILAAIRQRFPQIREPKQQDICYATQNRQDAVKQLAGQVDVLIVVGSPTSTAGRGPSCSCPLGSCSGKSATNTAPSVRTAVTRPR